MDDQHSLEQQLLGEMTYDDPRKNAPQPAPGGIDPRLAGASQVILDDSDYVDPRKNTQPASGGIDPRLAGASAVTLDDMTGSAPAAPKPQMRFQELTDEQIAILQQQRAAKGQPPYTPEEIADLKAEFIERQRNAAMQQAMAEQAAAQQQAAAALLSEPEEYTQPEKKEAPKILPEVDASTLLEEPAPEPERKVVFNQADLEAAKKQAAKRASEALTEAPAKTEEDQKRAREELKRLREQQLADLAQKGFTVSIISTVMGVFAGIATLMFSMGNYEDDSSAPGIFKFFDKCYLIFGVLLILLSITIVTRLKKLKGFTTFMFVITAITMVVPGIVELLSQKRGAPGFGLTAAAYVLSIVLSIAVTVNVSSSDKLNAYYAQSDIMYD
ncbi:MAG: hypothetical protein IKQ39_06645 [Oscillospiraceae bacterium]|nr:hypothetical protein [Oscillospiraceae bacterium]